MSKQIVVELVTEDFRGDHARDVRIALDVDKDETIGELTKRAFSINKRRNGLSLKGDKTRYQDHLEIRLTRPKGD